MTYDNIVKQRMGASQSGFRLAGLTREDRENWDATHADWIQKKRSEGATDQYLDQAFYNSKFVEVFGKNAFNALDKQQREDAWNQIYLKTDQEVGEAILKQEHEAFINDYIASAKHREPKDTRTISEKIVENTPEIITRAAYPAVAGFINFDDIKDQKESKSRVQEYLEENPEETNAVYNPYSMEPLTLSEKKEAQNTIQEEDSLSKLRQGKLWTAQDVYEQNPEEATEEEISLEKYDRSRRDAVEVANKPILKTSIKEEKELEGIKQSRLAYERADSILEHLISEQQLGNISIEQIKSEIQNISNKASGYYQYFKDYDKIQNISDSQWRELYAQYKATEEIKGTQTANQELDYTIQKLAQSNEGILEKSYNGLAQAVKDIEGTAITTAGYMYGAAQYATGNYKSQEGLSDVENFLMSTFVDNDLVKYGAAITETGTLDPYEQKLLKDLGLNRYMITNPDQEVSWATTPFEVLGQHGFTIASMFLSLGLSKAGTGLGKLASNAVKHFNKISKVIDPKVQQQILDKAAKMALRVENGFNGVFVPMAVGMPEASMNAVSTQENVLREGKSLIQGMYNEEFDRRLEEKAAKEFQSRMDEALANIEFDPEKGYSVDIEQLEQQIGAQIIKEVQDELNWKYDKAIEQLQYSADRAALNTLGVTALLNGALNSTLKAGMLYSGVGKSLNRVKRSIGIKPSPKFTVSEVDGARQVRAESMRTHFVDKFGDKWVNRFLDDVTNYGWKATSNFRGEFGEEYGQGVMQGVSEGAAMHNIMSFTENMFSGDGTAELYSYMDGTIAAAANSLFENATKAENIHAGILGGLSTLIPSHRWLNYTSVKDNPIYQTDKQGNVITDEEGNPIPLKKWQRFKNFNKGITESIRDNSIFFKNSKSDAQQTYEMASAIEDMLNNDMYKAMFEGMHGVLAFDQAASESAKKGDKFGYKNNMLGVIAHQAHLLSKLEGTDYYNSVMEHLQHIAQINTSTDSSGTFIDQDAYTILEQVKNNVQYAKDFEGMSDTEIVQKVVDNASKYVNAINTVQTRSKELDRFYGSEIDDDVKASIIWGEMSLSDYDSRIQELDKKTRDVLQTVRSKVGTSEDIDNPNISNKDKNILIEFGSQEAIEKEKKDLQENITKLKDKLKQIEKEKYKNRDVTNNWLFTKRKLRIAEKRLKKLNVALSKEAQESEYVFTAQEILDMDSITRAKMLDEELMKKRSEKQQKEIQKVLDVMTSESRNYGQENDSIANDLKDLARLEVARSQMSSQYVQVLANPKVYNEYLRDAKIEYYNVLNDAQIQYVDKSSSYKEFFNRVQGLLSPGYTAAEQVRNIKVAAALKDNPYMERYLEERDFIETIGSEGLQKVMQDKGLDFTISDNTLVGQMLNYIATIKNDDDQFSLKKVKTQDLIDIIEQQDIYDDFIKYLEDVDTELAAYAQTKKPKEVVQMVADRVTIHNTEEQSKIENQEVEHPEVNVSDEAAAPVMPDNPQMQEDQLEDEDEQFEKEEEPTEAPSQEENPVQEKQPTQTQKQLETYKQQIEQLKDSVGEETVSSVQKAIQEVVDNIESQGDLTVEDAIEKIKSLLTIEHSQYASMVFNNFLSTVKTQTPSQKRDQDSAEAEAALKANQSTIHLVFKNSALERYFSNKVLNELNIEGWLETHTVENGTTVHFIAFYPSQGADFANGEVYKYDENTIPILACVESEDGNINIGGKKYQAIGMLPSSYNTTASGVATANDIRQYVHSADLNHRYTMLDQVKTTFVNKGIKKEHPDSKEETSQTPLSIVAGQEYPSDNYNASVRRDALTKKDDSGENIIIRFFRNLIFGENKIYYKTEHNYTQDIIKSNPLDKKIIENTLDRARSNGVHTFEGGGAYISGGDQDIVTLAMKLKQLLNIERNQNDQKVAKDTTALVKKCLQDLFYISNNSPVAYSLEDNKLIVGIGDRTIKIEVPITSNTTDSQFVELACGLLNVLVDNTAAVYYQIDNAKLEEFKNKIDSKGWDNLEDNDKQAIVRYVDRLFNRAAYINRNQINDIVSQVTITAPKTNKVSIGGISVVATMDGQKDTSKATAPISKPDPKQDIEENNQRESLDPTIEEDGIESNSKGRKVSVTTIVHKNKEFDDIDTVIAPHIGNTVDMIVKDLVDNVVGKNYPNMSKSTVEYIQQQVDNYIRTKLEDKGYKVEAGGRKEGIGDRRLHYKGQFSANVDGKTINLPISGEFDLLAYNETTGKYVIVDVKTIRGGDLSSDTRQQYYEQLTIYREILSQNLGISKDNIELALITVPMHYSVNSANNFSTKESKDPYEEQQLYDGEGKKYQSATIVKDKKVSYIEVTPVENIDEVICKYLKEDAQIVNDHSQQAQLQQEAFQNSEQGEVSAPEPIIKKDSTVTPVKNQDDKSSEDDNDLLYNVDILDSSDMTQDEIEQDSDCRN